MRGERRNRTANILVVGPRAEDYAFLRRILSGTRWRVESASGWREALAILRRGRVPLVICDQRLADGDWRELLVESARLPLQPRVVVASTRTDHHVWTEALSRGAYDVLMKPFDPDEVLGVVTTACLDYLYVRLGCVRRLIHSLEDYRNSRCGDTPRRRPQSRTHPTTIVFPS